MKKYLAILAVAFVFILPSVTYAAPLVDNIDSYSTGALNGQGSWSANAGVNVENSVSQSSPNAISIGLDFTIQGTKSFTLSAADTQTIWGYATGNGDSWRAEMREGGTGKEMWLVAGGNLRCYVNDAAGFNDMGAFSINTWHQMDYQWDKSLGASGQGRCRLDGGTWTSYQDITRGGGITSGYDSVRIVNDGNTDTVYFDTFSNGAAVAAPRANNYGIVTNVGWD